MTAFVAEELPGSIMRGVPRDEWTALGLSDEDVRATATANTAQRFEPLVGTHRADGPHPRRRMAGRVGSALSGQHADGARRARRRWRTRGRRRAARRARSRRRARAAGFAPVCRAVRAPRAAGVARRDEPVLARGADHRRAVAARGLAQDADCQARWCFPGSRSSSGESAPSRLASWRATIALAAPIAIAAAKPTSVRTAIARRLVPAATS